jgi:hypothetical protein
MISRRDWIGAAALGSLAGATPLERVAHGAEAPAGRSTALPPGAKVPAFTFVYECDATIAPPMTFGPTPEGQRRVIPITGGTFRGPRLRGEVVANGADWNLSRTDGAGSVDAAYYLKTDDGVLIRVVNQGVGRSAPPDPHAPERFFMYTHPSFEAPNGKYDWLNRSMFIGTLGARRGAQNAVLIRVFELT